MPQKDILLEKASIMIKKSLLSEEDKKMCLGRTRYLSHDILEIFVAMYESDPQELAFFVQNLKQKMLLMQGTDEETIAQEEKNQLKRFLAI